VGITKNEIVQASLRILNRSGIGSLSMRTIARELNIKAASLYNHISGKLELYSEIVEYMCKDFAVPDTSLGAKEYLIASAIAYRAMLLTVRDSAVIFEDSFPITPRWIAISKSVMERFVQLGVNEKNRLTAGNLYNNYILSSVQDEVREKNRTPDERQLSKDSLDFDESLLSMHEGKFDEQFLFGLRVLMRGLEEVEREHGC
jgi:AcrR family transcriptional regulator